MCALLSAPSHAPGKRLRVRLAALGVLLLVVALATGCAPTPPPASVAGIATVQDAALDELSGIAASRRTPGLLWAHNDSDGRPVLYALGFDGKSRGGVRLAGVKNVDWEDMASFELDGQAWLLVADAGDNGARRKDCALYVVAEPAASELSPERELELPVAWKIPVRYPDGPHDCESVAVDVRGRLVYLLRKREWPNPLFTLPLRPDADETPVPLQISLLNQFPQPNSQQRAVPVSTGRYRANPTSMDISADGRSAVVLTYGDVFLFQRQPGENWAKAFSRKPATLPPHGLAQAEAVGFSADGRSVFVVEEKANTALLRYTLAP